MAIAAVIAGRGTGVMGYPESHSGPGLLRCVRAVVLMSMGLMVLHGGPVSAQATPPAGGGLTTTPTGLMTADGDPANYIHDAWLAGMISTHIPDTSPKLLVPRKFGWARREAGSGGMMRDVAGRKPLNRKGFPGRAAWAG